MWGGFAINARAHPSRGASTSVRYTPHKRPSALKPSLILKKIGFYPDTEENQPCLCPHSTMAKIIDKIRETLARGDVVTSFEFFPAKTEQVNVTGHCIALSSSLCIALRHTCHAQKLGPKGSDGGPAVWSQHAPNRLDPLQALFFAHAPSPFTVRSVAHATHTQLSLTRPFCMVTRTHCCTHVGGGQLAEPHRGYVLHPPAHIRHPHVAQRIRG